MNKIAGQRAVADCFGMETVFKYSMIQIMHNILLIYGGVAI